MKLIKQQLVEAYIMIKQQQVVVGKAIIIIIDNK